MSHSFIVFFVYAVIGIVIIIFSLRTIGKSFLCTLEIPVTCINVKQRMHHDYDRNEHTMHYAATWAGYVNGQYMTFESKSYTSNLHYEGEESTIKINPNDPSVFLEPELKLSSYITLVFGIVIILYGIYSAFL